MPRTFKMFCVICYEDLFESLPVKHIKRRYANNLVTLKWKNYFYSGKVMLENDDENLCSSFARNLNLNWPRVFLPKCDPNNEKSPCTLPVSEDVLVEKTLDRSIINPDENDSENEIGSSEESFEEPFDDDSFTDPTYIPEPIDNEMVPFSFSVSEQVSAPDQSSKDMIILPKCDPNNEKSPFTLPVSEDVLVEKTLDRSIINPDENDSENEIGSSEELFEDLRSFDDDSFTDPTYIPEPIDNEMVPFSFSVSEQVSAPDQSSKDVINVKKNASQKQHCCFYCNKLIFKIYRHYISVHKKEEAVKEIVALPEKTPHRKMLLDNLRKKGDYVFNTQLKRDDEKPIVCRQTLKSYKTVREKNVPCPSCAGYYSKYSIRHHLEKCLPVSEKGRRRGGIQVECRKLENNIHPMASDYLRKNVFPVLHEDEVTNAIRYDEAVITYANYLCRKYTTPHHAAQIRSNMRALGRLILIMKKLNPGINNLYDALDAGHVDLIIRGIDEVAGLDKTSNLYRAPATAMLLATELKKLCKLLLMEFIKKRDKEAKKRMEDLYSVFELEFHVTVNKKGLETQKINNRRKRTILPKTDQIAEFRIYLENKIEYYINKLEKEFCKEQWARLAEYTLVHLAVFNRKRPGETQRILIEDYKHYEVIENDEVSDAYDSLSKEQIKKWARIQFTGKLGNNTALLVHRKLGFKAIDLILKYRERAGVNNSNRYVFGEPSQFRTQSTFQACQLIRKFASESGVKNSQLLRTRLLRQHLATETATSSVDNRLEGRVSDFMAHKRKIHDDYYVLTQKNDDIIKVSKLLENFSSSNEQCSYMSVEHPMGDSHSVCGPSDESDNSSDEAGESLTKYEVNYVIGKKQCRHTWNSTEKATAKKYFHNEIYNEKPVEKAKVTQFFKRYKDLYKNRTPHLIMQWVKGAQEKVSQEERGIHAKRLRWSTPEKEVLISTTERHSTEGTIPTVPECELLFEQHDVLKNRNPHSIKSYIYTEIKKQSKNNSNVGNNEVEHGLISTRSKSN